MTWLLCPGSASRCRPEAIVTPPGSAAILALAVLREGKQPLWFTVMGLLVLVMVVNLLPLLAARRGCIPAH